MDATLLKYKTFIITLSKRIFWGAIIGIIIGSTTAFLITVNDFLGDDIREKNDWMIFFLPLGGIILGYM
jgi:H+/Cl- antiporter ClcA